MADKVKLDRTEKIVVLHRNRLNLTHIHLLRTPEHYEALGDFQPLNHLVREGYIYNNKVTEKGKDLLKLFKETEYEGSFSTRGRATTVEPEYTPEFLEFWDKFPSNDTFKYGGKMFVGTRSFKVKKSQCYSRFNKLLEKYSYRDIIHGTAVIVSIFKNRSIKEGKNIMTYMSNTYTFLDQEKFEPYIHLKVIPEPQPEKVQVGFV